MKLSTCVAVVLAVSSPALARTQEAPLVLESHVERHSGPPLWVSARAVVQTEGGIDLERVGSVFLRKHVEKQRLALGDHVLAEKSSLAHGQPVVQEIPLSSCRSMIDLQDDRGGDASDSSFSALVTNSRSVLRGRIRRVELGFSFGTPSSLLEIEPLESVKGPAPRSKAHVDYPIAHFRIGPYDFCNANRGFEPRPGDQILLFDYTGPVDREDLLYAPRFSQLFFEDQSGALILPPALKRDPELEAARNLNDVIRRIPRESGLPRATERHLP